MPGTLLPLSPLLPLLPVLPLSLLSFPLSITIIIISLYR